MAQISQNRFLGRGVKQWYRTAYIRKAGSPNQDWIVLLDALPRPLAYGASIQLEKGVLCIGGCDDEQCYSEVFLLTVQGDSIRIDSNYPSLPVPLANMTASLIDNKVFVAGGQEGMHIQSASSHFFMLDLDDIKAGWKALSSWPGAPRGYAVSAGQSDGFDKCFYLFSGRNYHDDVVDVLTDGYVYNPRLKTWKKLKGYFPVMAGAAVAHNFGLASSGEGPTANGKIAVVIGLVVLIVIATVNSMRKNEA